MRAVLIVEIVYDDATVTDGTDARNALKAAAEHLYSNGLLTAGTEMEIETVEDKVYVDYE